MHTMTAEELAKRLRFIRSYAGVHISQDDQSALLDAADKLIEQTNQLAQWAERYREAFRCK
jgi:hypothetical protein